jgi:hypothetical protein
MTQQLLLPAVLAGMGLRNPAATQTPQATAPAVAGSGSLLIGAIGAALLVLTPLALYFVLSDDLDEESARAHPSGAVRRPRRFIRRVSPAGAISIVLAALVLHVPELRALRPVLDLFQHFAATGDGFLQVDQ